MGEQSFLTELKRRNVIRMAGLYLVGAWLIVQVAGTVLPMFGAPAWIARTVVILLAIGFVPALGFAWVFELTPDGLKRDGDVAPGQSIAPHTARRMDRMIIAVLALALVYFGFDKFVLAPKREAAVAQAAIAAAPPAKAAATAADAIDAKSIAVLPFVDMSETKDQEYFSDGIAEELLNRLAQVPELRVAARTSAFQFKGRNLDIADIGRQLKVAHVLEGSVRKSGTRLRITAQLINSASGMHLWSQSFDADAGDVFKVQEEIAGAIATALQAKLAGAGAPAAEIDPQAYDDYLQGRAYVALRIDDNISKAIAAFDKAIARSPDYAAAHSGRAFALSASSWDDSRNLQADRDAARVSAERALALNPRSAEAHLAIANVADRTWQLAEAREHFEQALALAPDNVDILNFHGDFLALVGDLRGGERAKRKAMALDPLAWVHPLNLSYILILQRRGEDAQVMAQRALDLGHKEALLDVYIAQMMAGRLDEAERTRATWCKQLSATDEPCPPKSLFLLAARGQREEAAKLAHDFIRKTPPDSPARHAGAATLLVIVGDFPQAARHVRASLGGTTYVVMSPLTDSNRGAVLPEELSRDPEWLAVWQEPKLRELMAEYRRNLTAFRNGG